MKALRIAGGALIVATPHYVTVVKDPNDPKAKGSIVKIPNVD